MLILLSCGLILAPVTVVLVFRRGLDLMSDWDGQRRADPGPGINRIDSLAQDLKRLQWDYQRTRISNQPYMASKLHAIALAYDDVLCDCLRELDLPVPPQRPLTSFDRLQSEAEVAQHGVVW